MDVFRVGIDGATLSDFTLTPYYLFLLGTFLFRLLTLATLAQSAVACSKTDAPGPSPVAPRVSATECRVRAPAADYVSDSSETETTTVLPATYSFKRTMKTGDGLSVLTSLPGGPATLDVKTPTLLDGKEVKRGTSRGVASQAVSVYVVNESVSPRPDC